MTVRKQRPRIVFCRVGWMRFYSLWPEDDGPIGGGSYNDDESGGEVNNFREVGGRYLGYVQAATGGETGLNLRRIDPAAGRRADSLDDVLVVLVARRPTEGGQVVVGWYAGATCHSAVTHWRSRFFVWSADPERAVLLPRSERSMPIPKGKGGMGQSNVAYAYGSDDEPHDGVWIDETIDRITRYAGPNLIRGVAYDDVHEIGGHREARRQAMLDHVIERGVKPLWPGTEIVRSALGEPYDVIARRGGAEERIIIRVSETADTHADFSAELLDAVAASPVSYSLLAVTQLAVRVRNGEFAFSGGVPRREAPFRPAPERLTPVVLRYAWGKP